MGHGSYTADDWTKLRQSKGFNNSGNIKDIFKSKVPISKYSCKSVLFRESRDSEDSPMSMPIIIGFDVTSSMGFLAKELAVNSLNKTIMSLYEKRPILYPHIMCSAIGDCKSDLSPLQVTQFEADIRIIEQLTDLYIEGGGGGNGGESYNLLWYFAANHTITDCFEKRNKKGFLFTIGDDISHDELSVSEVSSVFGDKIPYSISNTELILKVKKKYHVFHIHIETENSFGKSILTNWQSLLPGSVTTISSIDIDCLSELITSIISITTGTKLSDVLNSLDFYTAKKIIGSLSLINTTEESQTNVFKF